MIKNKKLLYGILVVVLAIVGISSFVYLNKPTITPAPESPIIIKQTGGAALLAEECANKSYITETADYIIEGIVERVERVELAKKLENKRNEEKPPIFITYYTHLKIEKYLKGTPFKEDKIQIMIEDGRVGEITQRVKDEPIFYEGKKVRIYFQKINGEFFILCGQMGVEEIGLGFEEIILYENGTQTTLDFFHQPDLYSKIGNLLTQEIQKINIKAKCLFTERDIREVKQKDSVIELIFKESKIKTALFILEDTRGKGLKGHILIGTERKEKDEKCFWRITEEQQKILGFCEAIVGFEWNEEAGYCTGISGCRFDPKIVPFETYEECEVSCGKIWSCWAILKEGEQDLDKSWIDKINSLLCNSEICQSKAEEPLYSICILPDKPTPKQLNYECKCVNHMCQWSK